MNEKILTTAVFQMRPHNSGSLYREKGSRKPAFEGAEKVTN